MITISAPAKINLTLEVIGKRTDGFHDIRSIVQTINLCDRIRFKSAKSIEITSTSPDWIAGKSLVSRAVSLLQESYGCTEGAAITVEKRIPLVAGLGGDSSDAAATLLGLNRLWKCGLSQNQLSELAGRLGSDVTFFLNGGTALMSGRGETVTPVKPLSKWWVVLAVPAMIPPPNKTKLVYESVSPDHYTDGQRSDSLAQRLNKREAFSTSLLYNAFEHVAFSVYPGLLDFAERLLEQSAPHVHLAGSGPTIFCIFRDKADATRLYHRLKDKCIETYLALTLASD
jgi:4-diphosphocytidyl-2-C-methyl-D-erythritol kinase